MGLTGLIALNNLYVYISIHLACITHQRAPCIPTKLRISFYSKRPLKSFTISDQFRRPSKVASEALSCIKYLLLVFTYMYYYNMYIYAYIYFDVVYAYTKFEVYVYIHYVNINIYINKYNYVCTPMHR